jgi:DNA-binding IclR family transcriptional regulator
LSLQQVAQRSALAPSTVHRMLRQLQNLGMVYQTPKRRYQAGGGLLAMSALAIGRSPLIEAMRPLISETMQRLEMSCILSLYMPSRLGRVVLLHTRANGSGSVNFEQFPQRDLVWGATGRAILAYLNATDIDNAIRYAPVCPANGSKADRATILNDLSAIRGEGYGASQGEVAPHGEAVAVPLFNGVRNVVGSLAVTQDNSRWNATTRKYLAGMLTKQSQRLPALLAPPT